MIEKRTLKNGVRVIVKRMEGLLSVTMGVLVGAGGAFETDEEDGISHFIEHVQFKGTKTRTAFEISDAFDSIGAQVNAFTGKDMTCYYAKATTDHAAEAFRLLADLFLHATFPEEELRREKGVILQEIKRAEDTPDDLCLDLLAQAAFGKRNYGRTILGPAENVSGFTREDIFRYKRALYCPQNIVISFAGNISAEEAIALAEEEFSELEAVPYVKRKKEICWQAGRELRTKPVEQVHLAIAFPGIRRYDPRYPAVQVLNGVLGDGMSSRLFKKVREELGLAYSVYSYPSQYEETGALTVYAGVEPENTEEALAAIEEVIRGIREEPITEEEFLRGREQIRAGYIFSQEATSSQMLLYGRNLLYADEVYDLERRMAEISSLKLADVRAAAEENFDFAQAAFAAVGPLEELPRL